MCDACVMNRVADRLGRRGMSMAAAAAAGVLGMSARPAAAQAVRSAPVSRVVDLTHTLRVDFPTFDGGPAFEMEPLFTRARDGYNLNRFSYGEHVGTHFDAPVHFSDGITVDRIPVESLVCPLVVLDVREKAAASADYQVSPEDIAAHEARHGRIPQAACLAMNSGWDERANGPGFRNADDGRVMHFPGFRPDVVPLLVQRNVAGVAVDTLSLDCGSSTDFGFHTAWLGSGRWGIECVAGLGGLPQTGATLVAGAPKIAGGTGGHGRVIALV